MPRSNGWSAVWKIHGFLDCDRLAKALYAFASSICSRGAEQGPASLSNLLSVDEWPSTEVSRQLHGLLARDREMLHKGESACGLHFRLVVTGGAEHLLAMSADSRCVDDSHLPRVLRDIVARYRQPLAESAPGGEPSDRQYGDPSAEPLSWHLPLQLNLPTDGSRTAVTDHVGECWEGCWSPALCHRLDEFSQDHKLAASTIAVAGVLGVWQRYTGEQAFPIIHMPQTAEALLDVDPTVCWTSFAKTLEAFWRARSTARVQDPANLGDPSKDATTSSESQVLVTAIDRTPVIAGSTRWVLDDVQRDLAGQELAIDLLLDAESSRVLVTFAPGRFRRSSVARMGGHIENFLQRALDEPNRTIAELSLLSAAERQQIVFDWNKTEVEFLRDTCLHELFESQVDAQPEATAVVFQERQLSYRELERRANRWANHLRALGVGPDVMVGICVERSLDMVVGLLAITKAGGAYVPIDAAYPAQRIQFMLDDTRVPVLLTQGHLVDQLPPHRATTVCLDDDALLTEEGDRRVQCGVGPENLAYVIYTSGSTGNPKGCMLNHRGRVNNFSDFNRRFGIGPGDRILALSSLSFDMSAYDVFGTLMAGGTIVIPKPSAKLEPAEWARLMREHEISVWHSVPALLEMMVDYIGKLQELAPTSLRLVLLGGDWIPLTLPDRIRTLVPETRVISMGGATECSMDSTIFEIQSVEPHWNSIPYGFPMANQRAYVLDRHLQPLPVGVPGELFLGGIGVGRGYLNRPELTAERFLDNPFLPSEKIYRTGDLARFGEDGNLELLGRIDHQVKIRGFRVELGEIEATLRNHAAVRECVVLQRATRGGDKRLVAYVVRNAAHKETGADNQHAQIEQWRQVYDVAYSANADWEQNIPEQNFVSWDSSYTQEPIPAEEMREWADCTVASIRELQPQRVLEIGCGMGLLLFRLAPDCLEYWGTDISQTALDYVERHRQRRKLAHVHLSKRWADDFSGMVEGQFDTVILNSIVLDFPDIEYLLRVLRGVARIVRPGGVIFVGDVRDLTLEGVFATSVQLRKAPASFELEQLRRRIRSQRALEEELLISPEFFALLPQHIPELSHAHIHLKRGHYCNELSKFRYDLTLYVGEVQPAAVPSDCILDWDAAQLSIDRLRTRLEVDQPAGMVVRNIPNRRMIDDVRATQLLEQPDCPATAGEIRHQLATVHVADATEPEDIRTLVKGYAIDVQQAASGACDRFDAVFLKRSANSATASPVFPTQIRPDSNERLNKFANNPLQRQSDKSLVPKLRAFLTDELPEYMVPSAFVLMDSFPLTPNGKIDRRALPEPDASRPDVETNYVEPDTAIEKVLAGVWKEVLGLDQVGVRDRFISLGGSSLLAAQIASRIRDIFQVDVPLTDTLQYTISEAVPRLVDRCASDGLDANEVANVYLGVQGLSDSEVQALLRDNTST